MRFEALPGSTLADQLRAAGYDVTEIGTTERISRTRSSRGSCLVPVRDGAGDRRIDPTDHADRDPRGHRCNDGL